MKQRNMHFPSSEEMAQQRQFVLQREVKDQKTLERIGLEWTRVSWANKMDYDVTWLGVPIIQNPYDMIVMQELIYCLRPDVIIETGIAHGGSVLYYSSLCELLGKGKVIGVDIEIREHNRKVIEHHPMSTRLTMIEGSSVEPSVLSQVREQIRPGDVVLVILDSDHRKPHVARELELYGELVTKGSYMVVFDTFIPLLRPVDDREEFVGNTPREAVDEYLTTHSEFSIDKAYNKFIVSSCVDGFLQKNV